MSTTTAAPTINVTAEDWEILRHDPYWISMAVLGHEIDLDVFDKALERSPGEHREWLDGLKTQIEWWVTLLKRIESGVLPAEPGVIEVIRSDAARLYDDSHLSGDDECDDWCRESCAELARRSGLLDALADRLEAALVGSEVPA